MTQNNTPQSKSHAIAEQFRDDLFNNPVRHEVAARRSNVIILAFHAETLGISAAEIDEMWLDIPES